MPTPFTPSTKRLAVTALLLFAVSSVATAQQGRGPVPPIRLGEDGRLVYTPDAAGNKIVDFSTAGYAGGGEAIPLVPAKIVVEPDGKNDRQRIQAALDLVAKMPAGPDGFRGAVLLKPGHYVIDTNITLGVSGVVLRGSGSGDDGTVLSAAGQSRRTLLEIGGRGDRTEIADSRKNVTDAFVPVGAKQLTVEDAAGFPVGTRVLVRRPCTAAWITQLGMGSFSGWSQNPLSWKPNSRDIVWERVVTAVDGNKLTLDAPITTALDKTLGGATVSLFDFPGRIDHVGVENLQCISENTGPKDEEHAWCCVSLDTVENAWVRQLTARHFVGYVVITQPDTRCLTIEDVSAQDPVSEIAAYRRRVFSIGGELTLVQRCDSAQGLHDFTTGFAAAGPNVFLQCRATEALDYSGPLESWASGTLYDNVIIRGNALRFNNREANGQGAGWTAANSVIWNCQSTDLQVQSPPGAQNYAFGSPGIIVDDSLNFDPRLMPSHDLVGSGAKKPDSLYLQQLAERKGADAPTHLARATIPVSAEGVRLLAAADVPPPPAPKPVHPLTVANAQFTIDGKPAFTSQTNWSWFLGQTPRNLARPAGVAITRFVPGTSGTGETDRLEDVVASLPPGGAFVHHYGLWYDRRRINHNFYGAPEFRADELSAPFMEQPWARSGQGTDWDGMSKYDLTKFNPWFFSRIHDFADLCDVNGRILYYNFYFQHPLEESRAHYVDFPWRPGDSLQEPGLPVENPAGNTFYDVSNSLRRQLHQLYIRHSLDVLKNNVNVVYGIDREYSGPLSFVQFWLDTVAQWQKENNKQIYIALEVPKAEMDAILADPVRRPMITAITFFNWNYRADGSLFAIEGGINKAPREQLSAAPQGGRGGGGGRGGAGGTAAATPHYRAYREYRDAYPDLILIAQKDDFPQLSAAIDKNIPAAARAQTRAAPLVKTHPESSWAMAAPGKAYLVYSMAGEAVDLDLSQDTGTFTLSWLDSTSGEMRPATDAVTAGKVETLTPPSADAKHPWVAWLTRR